MDIHTTSNGYPYEYGCGYGLDVDWMCGYPMDIQWMSGAAWASLRLWIRVLCPSQDLISHLQTRRISYMFLGTQAIVPMEP